MVVILKIVSNSMEKEIISKSNIKNELTSMMTYVLYIILSQKQYICYDYFRIEYDF